MKIRVIGCGNASSMVNFNQSFLLEESNEFENRKLLIDCGYQVPLALHHAKINLKEINDIYISHAHADHVGGLEYMAFSNYDWVNKPRNWKERKINKASRIIANEKLLHDLWKKTLRGGLESMESFDASIETFFEPVYVQPNEPFFWMGWEGQLIQQIHIMTGSIISNTFGLMLKKEGHKTVYFTMDSQHCSPRQMENFYKDADIIFQDCECIGVDTTTNEFKFGSGVHANYAQLAGYPSANSTVLSKEIKSKMLLSHYDDFVLKAQDFFGNHCNWYDLAEDDGFGGFVQVGDIIEV